MSESEFYNTFLYLLIFICAIASGIFTLQIYKAWKDCQIREARRKRQEAIWRGKEELE